MSGDVHVRFRERLGVRFPRATRLVGKVLTRLRDLELEAEVVIIFLADHGESLGERGLIGHNNFTTEQLRVPLIMRVPGLQPRRSAAPVQLIDVMPSIFSLLGQAAPYPFLGADLVPLMTGTGPGPADDRIRFSENKGFAAVLQGPWKVILRIEPVEHTRFRLFNLDEDPGELVDLAEERSELALQLIREYERLFFRHSGLRDLFPRVGEALELDEETLRDLRALGYLR